MPDIGMYFNKEEVHQAIVLGRFKCFADIPEQFLDEDLVCDWVHFSGSPIDKFYAQVPQRWRSDGFLKFAADGGCNVLKDTNPKQTHCYRELVRLCVANDCWDLRDVHPTFRDNEIKLRDDGLLSVVLKRLGPAEFLKLIKDIDWIGQAMSDNLIQQCCRDDFAFALDAPPGLLRQDVHEYMDLRWPKVLKSIRDCGRLDLLSTKLVKDGWPESHNLLNPTSLSQAIDELRHTSRMNHSETLYMGYIMRFPIEDVVPAMSGSRLKKLLLEMYSVDELQPHMKQDNGLKAVLLDDALGL
jgi:hypothetical protein